MHKYLSTFQMPSYGIVICMKIDDSVNGKFMEVCVIC
jgi:hypothetical protein